jgi:AcrR family transcriptional regulator
MKDRRHYQSATRTAQKAQTRQSILDIVAAALTRGEFDSISMEQIATAAGVAPATLYRYFPNREALLDGLVEQFDHVMGDLPYPQTLTDLTVLAERSFTAFDRDPALVRAFLVSQLGRTARQRGRPRRIEAIRTALQPITQNYSATQRRAAEAIIAHLSSIQTWQTMTEEFGMTGADVGQAVAWAIGTLIRDLQTPRESDEGAQDGTPHE